MKLFRKCDIVIVGVLATASITWGLYLQSPSVKARTLLAEIQYGKGSLRSAKPEERWLFYAHPFQHQARNFKEVEQELISVGEPAIPVLMKRVNNERSLGFYEARILVRIGPAGITPAMELLHDGDGIHRSWAALVLGEFTPPARQAIAALTEALNDPFPPVRMFAAQSLYAIDPVVGIEKGLPVILSGVDDPSPSARNYACWMLGKIGPVTPEAEQAIARERTGPYAGFFN